MTAVNPSAYGTFFQTFRTDPQVVSTSVQPRLELRQLATVTPNAGRITTSPTQGAMSRQVVRNRMPAPQLIVHVRVVDDLAGQEHARSGKRCAPVGIVDRAIDAVAEAEFASQVDGQSARLITEIRRLDPLDDMLW